MWEDPIVAEVHRIRQELAGQHNFDVHAIFADIRKRQAAHGSRFVAPGELGKSAAEGNGGEQSDESASAGSKPAPAA